MNTKTKIAILNLLKTHGEQRGVELYKANKSLGLGMLYIHLGQLEDAGEIVHRKSLSIVPGALPVTFWSITDRGQEVLKLLQEQEAKKNQGRQSRRMSFIEVCTGTFTGLLGSWLLTTLTFWAMEGKYPAWVVAAVATGACTVWSLVRNYFIRRHFNRVG